MLLQRTINKYISVIFYLVLTLSFRIYLQKNIARQIKPLPLSTAITSLVLLPLVLPKTKSKTRLQNSKRFLILYLIANKLDQPSSYSDVCGISVIFQITKGASKDIKVSDEYYYLETTYQFLLKYLYFELLLFLAAQI